MPDADLRTYLNDHLAGALSALQLLEHAKDEHAGTELGDFLEELHGEIALDQGALREIMASLGVEVDRPKLAIAWAGEKAARLKIHSPFASNGHLSTLLELEQLFIGITGKLGLWRALAAALGATPRLDELIARAERQREAVERHRLEAGRAALAPGAA